MEIAPVSDVERAEILKARRAKARRNFRDFVPFVRPGYDAQWFHQVIADQLQRVYERKTKKLMIFVPPQHGKSEIATRSFPAWVLGKNPNEKIAIVSYSAGIASKFNRDIKRRMESSAYLNLFPNTRLGNGRDGHTKNNVEFEIVGADGYGYSVGVEGALTSKTVDLGIIDDPVKDRQDAQSPTIQENTWDFYTDVFETRLHNESVQVVIQTRWHQSDLSGRLLARDGIYSDSNPTGWVVISFPALRTEDQNDFDPRPVGAALWPEKHSQAKIEKIKGDNPITFNALYQQDPKPSPDSLVFPNWIEIDNWPAHLETQYGIGGDFGYTNDPTAVARIAVERNRIYVDELIHKTGLTNQLILKTYHALKLPVDIDSVWDKAEPKSIAELKAGVIIEDSSGIVKLKGINARASVKGPGSIEAGISKLNEYTVYYTSRSLNIKYEKNHYQYVMHNGVSTNVPIDANNHQMDAIRGYIFTRYGKPLRVLSGPRNDYQ